jgi:hypothetical protein
MSDPTWHDLGLELRRWSDEGLIARFWVRDDDAIEVTPQLRRLQQLADLHGVQVGLAVIPANLRQDLADLLQADPRHFMPMCHGWAHVNHGVPGDPGEFGESRPIEDAVDDARKAFAAFRSHFPEQPVVFVPPYGRIAGRVAAHLPQIGFAALSNGPSIGVARLARLNGLTNALPRSPFIAASGSHLDVHIDPIDWVRKTARGEAEVVKALLGELRMRRKRHVAPALPIGILTHHLVHDEAIWRICDGMIECLQREACVRFVEPGSLVAVAGEGAAS